MNFLFQQIFLWALQSEFGIQIRKIIHIISLMGAKIETDCIIPVLLEAVHGSMKFQTITRRLSWNLIFYLKPSKGIPCLGANVAGSLWKWTLALRPSQILPTVSISDNATSDTFWGLLRLFRRCINVYKKVKMCNLYWAHHFILKFIW